MSSTTALKGIATVNIFTNDLAAAKVWYTKVLDLEPYFAVPGYVEFRIGDYQQELGIIDRQYVPNHPFVAAAGALVYWHVDEIQMAVDRLISLGATLLEAIKDRGHGFITASMVDPFGNLLGIMQNPHYLEVRAAGVTQPK